MTRLLRPCSVLLALVLLLISCGSEDSQQGTLESVTSDAVPFPIVAPPGYELGTVVHLDEPTLFGGRRAGEQATDVVVFDTGDGGAPLVVSVSDQPGDDASSLDPSGDVGGHRAYEHPGAAYGDVLPGVPQDLPALIVHDPDGRMILARRDAGMDELRALAEGLDVTSTGELAVDDLLGLDEIGRLDAPWITPEGAVLPEFERTEEFAAEAGIAIRRIDGAEATALLALANPDPEESLRTAASADLANASAPETVVVGDDEGTVATIASGFRALIVPDPGFMVVSNGSTPGAQFLSTDQLVAIGAGIEFVEPADLEARLGARHSAAFAAAVEELRAGRFQGFVHEVVWDADDGTDHLAVLHSDGLHGDPPFDLLVRLRRSPSGRIEQSAVGLQDGTESVRFGVGQAGAALTKVVGGLVPAATVSVEVTVDDVVVEATPIVTGAEGAQAVFYEDVPGQASMFGGEQVHVRALAADGSVLAEASIPGL